MHCIHTQTETVQWKEKQRKTNVNGERGEVKGAKDVQDRMKPAQYMCG